MATRLQTILVAAPALPTDAKPRTSLPGVRLSTIQHTPGTRSESAFRPSQNRHVLLVELSGDLHSYPCLAMAAPGQESRFWLSLAHSGQRIREELNEELPDTSIPLSKCVVGGFEGDAFDLLVSKDAYPNGVHIYTRKRAKRTDRFLEGIRDDVWNFYKDDPSLAGRLDPCWKFHLEEWEFGKTDLVWILVVGLTDTGAYDGRGDTKGFLIRSQPLSWQVANTDAYLHEVLASLKVDSSEDRQDANAAIEPEAPPEESMSTGPVVPRLPVTALTSATSSSSAAFQAPVTLQQPFNVANNVASDFDPLAAARLALVPRRPAASPRPASGPRSITSPTPRAGASTAVLPRGVKRNQVGGHRLSPAVGSIAGVGEGRTRPPSPQQPRGYPSSTRQEQQSRTATDSIRGEPGPQRPQQDRVVQSLPRVQMSKQSKGKSPAVSSPRRAPLERRQATARAEQSSPASTSVPRQDMPSTPAPISDRRLEKTRTIDPPPRSPVLNSTETRHIPIIEISDDSDSSLDAAAYIPFSDSEDSDDDVPLDAAYKRVVDEAADRTFAKTFQESMLLRRSPRLRQKTRSPSVTVEAPVVYDLVSCPYEPTVRAEALVEAFHRIRRRRYWANPQLALHLRADTPPPASNIIASPAPASSPASSPASTNESQDPDLRIEVEDADIPDWIKKVVGGGSPVGPLTVLPLQHRPDPGEPPEVAPPPRRKKDRPSPGLQFDISFKDADMKARWARCIGWRKIEEADAEEERKRLEKEHARYLHR